VAKKNKRRQQGKRQRPTFAPPPAASAPGVAAAPRPAGQARVGGNEALVRSVEMSLAPRAAGAGRKGQRGGLVLESVDPAIPLDRVPYFTSDLRKLGVTAVIMVVVLVVAARLIPLLLH
jgi:hypothetical protein